MIRGVTCHSRLLTKDNVQDSVGRNALFLRAIEEGVVCLRSQDEDWLDECKVDEEDVPVLCSLRFEEGDGVGRIGEAVANHGETTACYGDCARFGVTPEEVQSWKQNKEDEEEGGGEHWVGELIGAREGSLGRPLSEGGKRAETRRSGSGVSEPEPRVVRCIWKGL
jgi:hypothetical protein